MAGIFQPTLQTQVTPESPVQQASPIASLAKLGESVITGLAQARDRAEVEARRNQPSYTQLKDERSSQNLSEYATQLESIEQMKGQISNSAYNLKIRQLNMDFLGRGVDISDPEFKQTREVVTGMPDAMVGRSDDEILLNNLRATPEGQAELSFAAQQLQAEGVDITPDNIAAVVRQRDVTKLAVDNMQIQDEASFRQAKPVINDMINMFKQDTQNAVLTLRDAGVPLSSSMIQQRYVDFIQLQTQIESNIPANVPIEQKNEVLGSLNRMEEFFLQLGMTKENGEIKLLNPNELQVQDKTRMFVSILGASDNAADNVLAMKLMDKNYTVDPATYSLIESRISELGDTTDLTPDWIEDSDIVVTNDLIKTYNNLVEYQQTGGMTDYMQEQKMRDGALSLVNPEERDKWLSMTNAQGWTATKAFGAASKGFSKQAILSGQMSEGFYNTMAGLALSLETIDITEEPISFAGVRKEVSSQLPDLIKTAESVDPTKGAAIRGLMFRSLSSQKFQYDTRIRSDEQTMGIEFNTNTGTYNVSPKTSNPQQLQLLKIVNEKYGGSLENLYRDNFRSIQWSDWPEDQSQALQQYGRDPQSIAQLIFTDLLPSESDFKNLLDLRNSSVYLNNIAMQLEPQASKDAREELSALAQDSLFAVGEVDLPSNATLTDVGGMQIAINSSMQPLITSLDGASNLTVEGADQRMSSLLSGPFQELQNTFGKPLVINDAIAKAGTSREDNTPNSRHFHGDAIDIDISRMSNEERIQLVDSAIQAGFQGFGFGNNILHIDMGDRRAWNYSNETFGGQPVTDLIARVRGTNVARPALPTPVKTGDIQTPEVDPNEGAPTNFTILTPDIQMQELPPAETTPVEEEEQPVEEAPQEQPTAEATPTKQPVVSPAVQALLDSLTDATEEEKQRIADFLGGQ